uniref:Uncharacterized protein n=1 Tax=Rhizophora mucronata TaxID=61149 RepID=A0A2P2NKS8_RHIMU
MVKCAPQDFNDSLDSIWAMKFG